MLRAQLARQRARLLELDAEVEAKRSALLEAMKQKEMLSKLRKRREHAFLHDLDRREAAFNDEVAMMRYVRSKVE
jgi:flagellar export protein FliJ